MALGTSNQLGGTGEASLLVEPQNVFRVYGASESERGPFSLYVENFPLP